MEEVPRPGPKPKRLYLRLVRFGGSAELELPKPRVIRQLTQSLDRVGRLVAHGPLTHPPGDLLVLRAVDVREVERVLRADPFRNLEGASYEILAWDPQQFGAGVNLELPPALGAGRLTQLQRVAIVVRDQARAVDWYQSVLGLTIRERDPETGYVELSLGRGAAALSLIAPRLDWGEPYFSEATARIGRATGIAFRTDSVRALELRLLHAGARITEPPRAQPWGGVSIRFVDPDGNEFLAFQAEDDTPKTQAEGQPTRPATAAPPRRRR